MNDAPRAPSSPHPKLGERLHEIRTARKLSLREVSELSGIAKSTLYKVEKSGMSLTYPKLLALSSGLQVDISDLFSPHSQGGSATSVMARREKGSLGEGYVVDTDKYRYEYLCNELIGKRMVPMVGVIKCRSIAEFGELTSHPGEEFTYVMDGAIEIHTAFYKPVRLEKGEYIYMDSTTPHGYVSVGEGAATTLCVCSSPDPHLAEHLVSLVKSAVPQGETIPVLSRPAKEHRVSTRRAGHGVRAKEGRGRS